MLTLLQTSRFNKRQHDFPSLTQYSDYLEEVENMTFNLIQGIHVAAIEAKIAIYQQENAEQIMINRARNAEELAAALAASKGKPAQIDNYVGVNQNSEAGLGGIPQGQYAPTFAGQPRALTVGGGDMLGYAGDDEKTMKLRAERGARAGGWSPEISKKMALQEAFASMW
ncbi:unnamed protein product [Lupinus luteus]|uniref:MAT1 centre domain-containing protein n=1 Tax=Lupinus luteus TaxID=3873 RepID=A0AAV1WZQ5_LUPLU